MTHEEFVGLVDRFERFAQRSPLSYRLRLGLLAGLGYAYIFLLLGIAVAGLAAIASYSLRFHRFHPGELKLIFFLK